MRRVVAGVVAMFVAVCATAVAGRGCAALVERASVGEGARVHPAIRAWDAGRTRRD